MDSAIFKSQLNVYLNELNECIEPQLKLSF